MKGNKKGCVENTQEKGEDKLKPSSMEEYKRREYLE